MKITFLSDNKTEKAKCTAEWGLSILIESGGKKILFDTGASDMFIRNAESCGLSLRDVSSVIISHGHYDHTEGLPAFCKVNSCAPVYIHKDAIGESYALDEEGNMENVDYGIRWSDEFKEEIRPRLILTQNVTELNDNMTLVADIPLLEEYPMTEKFFRKDETGEGFIQDPMNHEQFLVIEEGEVLYVFSGCSHKGVMSIIARVKELFPGKKVTAFIAGMHLYPLPLEEQEKIVDSVCSLGVKYVFPVHCTGIEAIVMFKERLKERAVIASAGESYDC